MWGFLAGIRSSKDRSFFGRQNMQTRTLLKAKGFRGVACLNHIGLVLGPLTETLRGVLGFSHWGHARLSFRASFLRL